MPELLPARLPAAAVALLLSLTGPAVAQTVVAPPQASVARGLFTQPFDVVLTTATAGATIRYTLNCSDPRTSAIWAEGPSPLVVRVDPTSTNNLLRPPTPAVVLRAYAYRSGLTASAVTTHSYVFPDRVLTQTRPAGFPTNMAFDMDPAVVNVPAYNTKLRSDLWAIPSMSVIGTHAQVFASGGLLLANNSSIEIPGSLEVMHPGGRNDQVDCGLTPHSWIQTKRSIRVYFRSQYGADKWRHDLFRDAAEGAGIGVQSFDELVLRAGFNDGIL